MTFQSRPHSRNAPTNSSDGFSMAKSSGFFAAATMTCSPASVTCSTPDASTVRRLPACIAARKLAATSPAPAPSSEGGNFIAFVALIRNPPRTRDLCVGLAGRCLGIGQAGFENGFGHMVERALAHHRTALEGNPRHAIDQRRRLILADGDRSGFAHLQHTFGAVLAHAGEDRADRASSNG